MPVALGLVAERPDHLAVAVVAALADVDVAAHQLERRVGADALDLLDRALDLEQRRDLHDPADRDRDQDQDEQQDPAGLDPLVLAHQRHGDGSSLGRGGAGDRPARVTGTVSVLTSPRAVRQRL